MIDLGQYSTQQERQQGANPADWDKIHAKMRAGVLAFRLESGEKMTTRDMCVALGWQGGTIHQIANETGLTVNFLLKAQA